MANEVQNRHYFYFAWYGYFSLLTSDQSKRLITAIGDFFVENTETDFKDDKSLQTIYNIMIKQLKNDKSAYDEKCAVNRANGAKGGRPPKESKENPPKREQSQREKEYMENFNAKHNRN